jgi:hypothetical protein
VVGDHKKGEERGAADRAGSHECRSSMRCLVHVATGVLVLACHDGHCRQEEGGEDDREGAARKASLGKKKASKGQVVEAQLILKWGGELTKLGRAQSILLGEKYRCTMYPGAWKSGCPARPADVTWQASLTFLCFTGQGRARVCCGSTARSAMTSRSTAPTRAACRYATAVDI